MVSPEASPWAKSGGLADVLGALPVALAHMGHSVATVIPRYLGARAAPATRVIRALRIPLGTRIYEVAVWELIEGETRLYLVDQPELFDRPGLYGRGGVDFPDNHIRFALLSKAALEISRRVFPADVIHCHDWQSSLVPAYLKDPRLVDPSRLGIRTLLTIHNLGYQGIFDRSALGEIGLPDAFDTPAGMEFWGKISFLKAGIVFADALNTVSRKYAEEIQTPEYGFGLDGLLREHRSVLTGIVNGADYSRWNPETDPWLPARYSASNLSGKEICKRQLLREMGLTEAAMARPLLEWSRDSRDRKASISSERRRRSWWRTTFIWPRWETGKRNGRRSFARYRRDSPIESRYDSATTSRWRTGSRLGRTSF